MGTLEKANHQHLIITPRFILIVTSKLLIYKQIQQLPALPTGSRFQVPSSSTIFFQTDLGRGFGIVPRSSNCIGL